MAVTHPGTNRARRYLTSVIESPNKHWSPPRTNFELIDEAAANGTDDDGSLKVIDSATTPATVKVTMQLLKVLRL